MRKTLIGLAIIGLVIVGGLFVTRPTTVDASSFETLTGDPVAGELVFAATGCASCHSNAETKLGLAGGQSFQTDFGTFYAPNISQHPDEGIGSWNLTELASAMTHGTSPSGQHYYPAFPYTSYRSMQPQDIADLFAYLKTTDVEDTPSRGHDLSFPFNMRVTLGGWKLLYLSEGPWLEVGDDPILARGQYLVEVMGHCGECHTPRNALGAKQASAWLAGALNPSGSGRIPNITSSDDGIGGWSDDELLEYFLTGFTPDFDVVGGSMASVQSNLAKLPETDLQAIVAYLKATPPL